MSDHPTQHIYAKCLKCSARWWVFTLPMKVSNLSKKVTCPNCYAKGSGVVMASDGEQSEYKPLAACGVSDEEVQTAIKENA